MLMVGVSNVWGQVTQTYTLSDADNGKDVTTGDVKWSIATGAITAATNMKLTGTITVTLPTGATLSSVEITKSNSWGSGATVVFASGATTLNTFSTSGTFTLSSNETDRIYTFTKGGTASKNAWVKEIKVTYIEATGTNFTVTYNKNEADGGEVPTDANEYESNDNVTVLGNTGALTKTGYSFAGWNTKDDGTGTDYAAGATFSITKNTVLYAKWTVNNYSLTKAAATNGSFKLTNAEEAEIDKANYQTKVTITSTPAEGYRVASIRVSNTDNSEEGFTLSNPSNTKTFNMPAYNAFVTVTFELIPTYTVEYYQKGVKSTKGILEGNPFDVTDSDPNFAGWSTSNNPTSPVWFTGNVTSNTTLYAMYINGGEAGDYEKVTSSLSDWRGQYLVAYSTTKIMDGSLSGGTTAGSIGYNETAVDATSAISGSAISAAWGNQHYVIIEAIDDEDLSKGYVIKSHSETTPYIYRNTNSNGLDATANKETAAKYPLTIKFNSESNIAISSSAGPTLHWNNNDGAYGGQVFRFYKNAGQENIYLYKKADDTYTYTLLDDSYNLTIASSGYSTLCLDYDAAVPTDAEAYYVTSVADSKATLALIEDNKIKAGEGVIVKGTGGATYTFTETTDANAPTANWLVGVTAAKTIEAGNYVLSGGRFVKCVAGTLAANKAYLPEDALSAKDIIEIEFEGATGIDKVEVNGQQSTVDGIFNLAGQKVGADYKGIVIVNGKKYLNK